MTKSFVTSAETVWAVNDVSLTAHTGEFVCLLGASGSGKTTLLNCLAGLETVDEGHVEVDGVVVSGATEAERSRLRLEHVGVVFQQDNLVEEFTALENVAFPLELLGYSRKAAEHQASEWLERVGIADLHSRYAAQMSGGQQQRVGIARALVGGRSVLLADEPTGSLDTSNSRALYLLLQQLCADGVTVVLSTHDRMAEEFGTRSVHMSDGRLRDGGEP